LEEEQIFKIMGYSKELIAEVKELYPDYPEMHKHAENGDVWLGRYLDDASTGGMALDEILTATTLEELQAKARLKKRRVALYVKWCDEDPRKENKSL